MTLIIPNNKTSGYLMLRSKLLVCTYLFIQLIEELEMVDQQLKIEVV